MTLPTRTSWILAICTLALGLGLSEARTADAGQLGFGSDQAGQGQVCYFGECSQDSGPHTGGANTTTQAPPPVTEANYGDEMTDFGVPEQSTLKANVGSPTPMTIPGAKVVYTSAVVEAQNKKLDFLLIDVWESSGHRTIPDAVYLAYAGHPGNFQDPTQQRLWRDLSKLTNGEADFPLVFFCRGPRCWESYNAALRAVKMGFSNVYWYRGGLDAWEDAKLPQGSVASQ